MSGSNSYNPASDVPPRAEADEPLAEGLRLTVHPLPQAPLSADPKGAVDAGQRRSGRAKMLLVLLVSAAPVIASYAMYFFVQPKGNAKHAELIVPTLAWPQGLALTDAEGRRADPALWRKQWTLVVFGSGRCDEACEKRLYAQRQLREMLGRERDRVDKLFIVVDDAPLAPTLTAALAATPPANVLRAPGAQVAAWLGTTPDDLVGRLYVIDPMGEWMMRTPRELDPTKFKRDLDRVLRASSSWDGAGK